MKEKEDEYPQVFPSGATSGYSSFNLFEVVRADDVEMHNSDPRKV